MILQTGMRTDIPAFYAKWFANRLREGYVLVRNPYHPEIITRYTLSPDVVDLIGFCTKNPKPMFPYMDLLKPYGQYWFVTITPYGKDVEPHVPDKEEVMDSFCALSRIVGIDCIGWRYDPILLDQTYTVERHIEAFEHMAQRLDGATHTVVISFIDLYATVRRNFPEAREVSQEDQVTLVKAMVAIGKQHGMAIKACAEGKHLEPYGVDCRGCMTQGTYERALKTHLEVPKDRPLRTGCTCLLGHDIGAYQTCGHLCRYCYANDDAETVRLRMQKHDPASPLLIGQRMPDEIIHEAKQVSWKTPQLSFFDYG